MLQLQFISKDAKKSLEKSQVATKEQCDLPS